MTAAENDAFVVAYKALKRHPEPPTTEEGWAALVDDLEKSQSQAPEGGEELCLLLLGAVLDYCEQRHEHGVKTVSTEGR